MCFNHCYTCFKPEGVAPVQHSKALRHLGWFVCSCVCAYVLNESTTPCHAENSSVRSLDRRDSGLTFQILDAHPSKSCRRGRSRRSLWSECPHCSRLLTTVASEQPTAVWAISGRVLACPVSKSLAPSLRERSVCVCMCVCVCVRERERNTHDTLIAQGRERETERERSVSVCMYVFLGVCERDRDRSTTRSLRRWSTVMCRMRCVLIVQLIYCHVCVCVRVCVCVWVCVREREN